MSESPPIHRWTIVTVTFNSSDALRAFWSGWRRRESVEWIVVDNHSTDDSARVARELGATQVIELERNIGFGAANNVGVDRSSGEYILFANPDLRVQVDDLPALERHLDQHGGLASPQLVSPDGELQPNGRGFPRLVSKVVNRLTRTHHPSYRLFGSRTTARAVCFLMGASICAARETVDALGGWDESFFVYYEDSDICLREWLRGGTVSVLGSMQWMHGWARETSAFRWRPWMLELQSAIKFYGRYPQLLGTERFARHAFPVIAAAIETPGISSIPAQGA